MLRPNYPVFDISNLTVAGTGLLNADKFSRYLSGNPHLNVVHSHTFYHLLYFTKGSGNQIIDFVKFPVQPGLIYFMRPGQVHHWQFDDTPEGYIVNFSPAFLDNLRIDASILDHFSFFNANDVQDQVLLPGKETQQHAIALLEQVICEKQSNKPGKYLAIAAHLINLFVLLSRDTQTYPAEKQRVSHHTSLFYDFKKLVEANFATMRLPKDYAALLFITPGQLNNISKEIAGIAAGEIIRNRVVLEAKRLLVNFNLTIADIADRLNFTDNSYFVRFFRKYTGLTPDAFRKIYSR